MAELSKAEKAKDSRLQKVYKSSLEQEQADLEAQHWCCAICERPFRAGANPNKTFSKAFYGWFRDHDHRCCPRRLGIYCGRCNRGLLCMICNRKIVGSIEKLAIPVDRLAAYFEKYKHIQPRFHAKAKAKRKRKK